MSDYVENPTRHSAHIRQLDREFAAQREDRADLVAYAARHHLLVKWEPTGLPGGELAPRLYRLGDIPVPWPPNTERR